MTTYVGITEHPPQLCQTSNKLCAELYRKFGKEAASLLQKFGITMIQWNSVTTIPVVSFETALAELDTLTPIWHLQIEA